MEEVYLGFDSGEVNIRPLYFALETLISCPIPRWIETEDRFHKTDVIVKRIS